MIKMDETTVAVMVVPMVSSKRSRSFAPKYWDTITLAPTEIPMNNTSSKFKIGPLAPTAARALSPTYAPTTMESTVL